MLALCLMLLAPYYAQTYICWHNRLVPISRPSHDLYSLYGRTAMPNMEVQSINQLLFLSASEQDIASAEFIATQDVHFTSFQMSRLL